jgi:hypothetical protein
MQLAQRIHFRTETPARAARRAQRRPAPSAPGPEAAEAAPASPTVSQRRVGPPEDFATYSCSCGFVFRSEVTTTVGCPHCGSQLAW